MNFTDSKTQILVFVIILIAVAIAIMAFRKTNEALKEKPLRSTQFEALERLIAEEERKKVEETKIPTSSDFDVIPEGTPF